MNTLGSSTLLASDLAKTMSYQCPQAITGRTTKTQVMCTLGPASSSKAQIARLLEAGMRVVRLNFSHGSHEQYRSVIANLRAASAETGLPCALAMDTRGPEIRIGEFREPKGVQLRRGQRFDFVSDHVLGDDEHVTIRSWTLWQHVQPGDKVILDYGLITFTVTAVQTRRIITVVDNSNHLGGRKHAVIKLQTPVDDFRQSLLSYQDTVDIAFAVENKFDLIAVSGVRRAEDLDEIRSLPGVARSGVRLLAKIDNAQVINENFDAVIANADGAVLCRSDIAVDLPVERIANIQKQIIAACNRAGKPVVVINHILATMKSQPRPTRAEATDIANMVLDGADCLALTNPTANGQYAVDAVTILLKIAHETELSLNYRQLYAEQRGHMLAQASGDDVAVVPADESAQQTLGHSLASSAVKTAWDVEAAVIIIFTRTGEAARRVSKYRPHCQLVCVTTSERTARQLLISRGCTPIVVGSLARFEPLVDHVLAKLGRDRLALPGDFVVQTSGVLDSDEGTHILSVTQIPPEGAPAH